VETRTVAKVDGLDAARCALHSIIANPIAARATHATPHRREHHSSPPRAAQRIARYFPSGCRLQYTGCRAVAPDLPPRQHAPRHCLHGVRGDERRYPPSAAHNTTLDSLDHCGRAHRSTHARSRHLAALARPDIRRRTPRAPKLRTRPHSAGASLHRQRGY